MVTVYTSLPGPVSIEIDGAPGSVTDAGLSVDLKWGGSHTFRAPDTMPVDKDSRWAFSKWEVYNWAGAKQEYTPNPVSLTTTGYGFTVKALYVKQFYFSVSSPYGAVQNQGWYNENSMVRAIVTGSPVVVDDRTRYYFWYWGDDPDDNGATSDVIKLTGPVSIEARWRQYFQLVVNISFDPFQKTSEFYPRGEVRQIVAKDYPDYLFQQWVFVNEDLPPMPFRTANVVMDAPHSLLALYLYLH